MNERVRTEDVVKEGSIIGIKNRKTRESSKRKKEC